MQTGKRRDHIGFDDLGDLRRLVSRGFLAPAPGDSLDTHSIAKPTSARVGERLDPDAVTEECQAC